MRSAAEEGLALCRYCRTVVPADEPRCPVCHDRIVLRQPRQLQRVWAFWLVALIAYVPANLLPIMETVTLGRGDPQTIIGGVFVLLEHHDYFIAGVVFVASIIIPTAKFGAIGWLAIAAARTRVRHPEGLHRVHRVVELVGRWSMIDVFVVAVLVALVQLGAVAQVRPGVGVLPFALTVIFSMLSAGALDPRVFWDKFDPEPLQGSAV
ncbi:paraquat-inducible protein A [Parvularcula dongshanensis]|uniref:Paraquat-inducible protein A n=1 Tax=Parvularcula dongshanensis TaxID=1173995 RepID=A0A840I4J2_9PROT|nr:paraquat-inducible protein A [Parvularcula dongshanensis]